MNSNDGFDLLQRASGDFDAIDPSITEFAQLAESAAYERGDNSTEQQRFWLCATAYVVAVVLVACGLFEVE